MGCKKQGAKKQGHCYSKREEAIFLNNIFPIFCNPYFGLNFFQGHKPTHVFKTRIVGAD